MADESTIDFLLGNLARALMTLQETPEFTALIPEVRVNLAQALPHAKSRADVAAVTGRITAVNGLPYAAGPIQWGASDHLSRLIIEVRKFRPEVNAAVNFRCNPDIVENVTAYCRENGLRHGQIDRAVEPAEVIGRDAHSTPWKISYLAQTYGSVPDIFYENAGWGKEPLYFAVGPDAVSVTETVIRIARRWAAGTAEGKA